MLNSPETGMGSKPESSKENATTEKLKELFEDQVQIQVQSQDGQMYDAEINGLSDKGVEVTIYGPSVESAVVPESKVVKWNQELFSELKKSLLEMTEKEYRERVTELATTIAKIVKDNSLEFTHEAQNRLRQDNAEVSGSIQKLKRYQPGPDRGKGHILIDTSFDPVYPASLIAWRLERVAGGGKEMKGEFYGIHWSIMDLLKKKLSPEDKKFFETVRTKERMEEKIKEYKFAREMLDRMNLDLEDPKIFSE